MAGQYRTIREFFEKYVPDLRNKPADREQVLVRCPFHEDEHPSLSLHLREGLFHCFGCQVKGGLKEFCRLVNEPFQNVQPLLARTRTSAEREEEVKHVAYPILLRAIERAHAELLANPNQMEFLLQRKGLTRPIIEKYKIGFERGKFILPVWDREGRAWAVVSYRPHGTPKYKLTRYNGEDRREPFNPTLYSNYVILCEGVMDCLCLLAHHFQATTPLIPSGILNGWMQNYELPERVIIITDNDEAGQLIRKKYERYVDQLGKKYYSLYLPEPFNDVSDFLVAEGASAFEQWIRAQIQQMEQSEELYEEVEFHQLFSRLFVHKKVAFSAFTASKLMQSYLLPKRYQIDCPVGQFDFCAKCPVYLLASNQREPVIVNVPEEDQLTFIDKNQQFIKEYTRRQLLIPRRCQAYEHSQVEYNLCEIFESIGVEEEYAGREMGYRPVTCIALSDETLMTSSLNYKICGELMPNPNTQQLMVLVKRAQPIEVSFHYDEQFDFSCFRPQDPNRVESIWERLYEIGVQLGHYTGILGREMEHAMIFALFCSPLYAYVGNEKVKTALDLFVVGDTRTGKSTIFRKMIDLVGAGKLVSAENMTAAGLIGGLQQLAYGKWMISWGILPQNDRKIVILDEGDALTPELFSQITSARATGFAEITKVQQAKAMSRLRFALIANPQQNLSHYSYPIQAINSFGFYKQDLSRFDLVLLFAKEDVPEFPSELPPPMEMEPYRQLVRKIWNTDYFDVRVPQEVYEYCRYRAAALLARYESDLPLFDAYSALRLLRLALALSMMMNISLTMTVVDVAVACIETLYQRYKLDGYVQARRQEEELRDPQALETLIEEMLREPYTTSPEDFYRKIYQCNRFTSQDLRELTGLSVDYNYRFIARLCALNAIRRLEGSRDYIKTRGFQEYLGYRLALIESQRRRWGERGVGDGGGEES